VAGQIYVSLNTDDLGNKVKKADHKINQQLFDTRISPVNHLRVAGV
jgi:hypothetical protein